MFDLYPYTNFHELNQDWILSILKNFENELKQAIDYKTIHYADPLQWNITTQYAPNTVVVDENTGIAYISKDAVPSGVLLSDKNYWMVIFDYQKIYNKIMSGVAFNEKDNETASKDLLVNDLVWYHGDLYRITKAISEGSRYVVGTNMVATTIESLLATYYGRDRIAQLLNDTVNVSGNYTLNARDIAETSSNRKIDVDGNDSVHVDGVTTVNRGGAVTEAYNSSRNIKVVGTNTETYEDTKTDNYNGKHIIKSKETDMTANSFIIHFPSKDVNLENLGENVVNVKDFGAVGNANYYDLTTNAFFTDSSKTNRPTSDVEAVNRAIKYALTNNINIVYFPNGNYYLPLWSYMLDASKLSFVGSGHSCLCREGSEANAMITLISTADLSEYTYARTPLKNISLHGNSFTGVTDEGENGIAGIEYGVKGNSDATLISPHINLENVTVQGFSCGLRIGTAYKSTLINFNAISCNYGIFILEKGLAQAVPLNIYNAHFEVCNHAVFCLAPRYNEINFFGGAFEYCRQFIASNMDIACYGTRFESDILAFMDVTNGVNIAGFNITNACLHLYSCWLLLLPNYESNVKYWQPNLSKLSKYDTAFFAISSPAVPGLFAEDLEIATDQWDSTSTYFINAGSKNLALFNSHLLGSIASKSNVVAPAYLLDVAKGFFNYTPT